MTENSLVENIGVCLNEENFDEVLSVLRKASNRQELYDKGLDLIPIVCTHFHKQQEEQRQAEDEQPEELDNCCSVILTELARIGNPKEILIGLLEQADTQQNDAKFKALLTPIQIVLKRLPTKRDKSLEWVLSVLSSHLTTLPLPKQYNLEGNERKLMDVDPNVRRIENVTANFLQFYEPFVEEVALTAADSKDSSQVKINQRLTLTCFLLQLLDRPLGFTDLSQNEGSTKSNLNVIAGKVVTYIKQLQSNFFSLFELYVPENKLEKKSDIDEEMNEKVSELSLATFFYLVFAEGIELSHFPSVYTHIYIVESCFPLVNVFLKHSEEYVMHKGILMTAALIKKLRDKELQVKTLNFNEHLIFVKNLINVMLQSRLKEFRQNSVSLLQAYVLKYNSQGRYHLLKCLLNSNDHPGVMALLIQCYKNNLNESISQSSSLPHFIGSNLKVVLNIVANLPSGAETDVLEQSDRIMATLNFIRFLVLRDPQNSNVTGFWNFVETLENNFLNPLQKALELSKAHYKLELKSKEEEKTMNKKSIIRESWPHFAAEQSEQVLKLALNTFDVIECVMCRIWELLDCAKKSL